jgi:hypothetical protein
LLYQFITARDNRAMLDFRDAWTFSSEHISVHGLQP